MRSFLTSLAILLILPAFIAVPGAQALSLGAPARTIETGGFSLSGSIGYTTLDVRDEEVTSKSFFVKSAFGGAEGVMPYLKVGFADLEAGGFEGSMDLAFGGGILFDILTQRSGSGFRAGLDAQVQWIQSSEGSVSLDMFESQVSLMGSVRTGGTSTYGGLSTSFINLDGGGVSEDENGQSHLFFGVDYYMDYNFYFNAEAHLFGQNMVSVGVGYQF